MSEKNGTKSEKNGTSEKNDTTDKKSKNSEIAEEDDFIVKSIGTFGLWQGLICAMASAIRLISAWNLAAIMFLTPRTTFYCIKFKNNTVMEVQNSVCYSDCEEYAYESDIFEETLISDFGLICENAWLASFTHTILMIGLFLGAGILGYFSDRYGRRLALLISITINAVCMLAICFAPNYWVFSSIRLLIGFATGGIYIISAVIVVETPGPKYTYVAGCGMFVIDCLAQAVFVGVAYLAHTWVEMLLTAAVAALLFLSYFLLLPETPRWLVSAGKTEEAVAVLSKAAKWNRLPTENIRKNIEEHYSNQTTNISEDSYGTYSDLFRNKKLCIRVLLAFILWFVNGSCQNGINQYVAFIGSNIYLTVMFSGFVQLVVLPVSLYSKTKFGPKFTIISALSAAGISMICVTFVPKDHWGSTVLGLLGLASLTLMFTIIYIFTAEIFPTHVRNTGLGITCSGSNIGAMIAPFLAAIVPRWIPSVIFAALPFLGVVSCLFLPNENKVSDKISAED